MVAEWLPSDSRRGYPSWLYSTKTDGMGIGLNLCRSIVESHQGRMRAENIYNGADVTGCCFSFWLPIGEPASVAPKIGRQHLKTPG